LKPGHLGDFIVCSCWSSYLAELRPSPDLLAGRSGYRMDVLGQRTGVWDAGDTQRAPEGAAPLR
jgi:hypothetical protein